MLYFNLVGNGAEAAEAHICSVAEKEDVGIQAIYMQESEPLVIWNLRLGLEDRSLSVALDD